MGGGGGDFLHCKDVRKFLKNLLPWNHWSEFGIMSQDCCLCDPFQKFFHEILIGRKTWPPCGVSFFHCVELEKFFKILLLWNRLSDFEIISQDCYLGDPFQKHHEILIHRKIWLPWGGGDFLHYVDMKKFLKKNLLLRNRWSEFGIISQDCSLCDPDPFKKYRGGGGGERLFALYGHEEILKKSFSLKPLVRIWNNFTRLFLVWPFSKVVHEYLIHRKIWPPWGEAFFNVWTLEKFFKILVL